MKPGDSRKTRNRWKLVVEERVRVDAVAEPLGFEGMKG
jgi:hypothetical protein